MAKILMIAPQPFFSPRGTPFSIYYRLLTLSELGHSVTLWTYPIGSDVEIKNVTIRRSLKIPFVNQIKIGPSFRKIIFDCFLFFQSFLYLLFHRKEYSILFVHEEALIFGAMIKKLFKIKLVYDMHSYLPQHFENLQVYNWKFVKKIFRWIEKVGIRSSDYVITICEDLNKVVTRFSDKKPCLLIQNTRIDPISLQQAYPDAEQTEKITQFLKENIARKKILYCGTLEKYQGISLLLESFAILLKEFPEACLMVIGGNEQQVAQTEDLIASLGIEKNVLCCRMVSPNTIKELIPKVDILTSSRNSGTNTPLKIYEFLASGKPIVATNVHSHTQILNDQVAFLADPNPESFSQVLQQCLQNENESQSRADQAKKYYTDQFSLSKYKNNIQKVVEGVLAS